MRTAPTEDQLCLAFAEQVKESKAFASWLLARTKFSADGASARLLHKEQMNIRPRKFWWRHWWCHIPELKKDRETDIFMVFEIDGSKQRFALHIENKKDNGSFAIGQAEAYKIRAQHMANKSEYLDYVDFETILVAPLSFKDRYPAPCELFDRFISYEEICKFVPEFGNEPVKERGITSSDHAVTRITATNRNTIDWDDAVADAYSHLNERKRVFPLKTMLALIDDLCVRGTASQADLIEKHGSADFIATVIGHVTTAVHGKGPVPTQDGWYRRTTSPLTYDVHPSFAEAWKTWRRISTA